MNLTPRIVLTQHNERIIAGVGEIEDNDGKRIGLILKRPYVLSMMPTGDVTPDGTPSQFNVNFTKWIPYSTDEEFRVPYNAVVAVGEVEPGILEIYLEKFGDELNDTDTLPTSDSSYSAEEPGVSDSGD